MLRILAATALALAGSPAAGVAQPSGAGAEIQAGRELLDVAVDWTATGLEIAGVAIIVVGVAAATFSFLHGGLSTSGWPAAFNRYRANLGRGILLGLELLVAADIIATVVVRPSIESVAVLGLIVLIRTFLSISLEVEIEGRWPWRRAAAEDLRHGRVDGREPFRRGPAPESREGAGLGD